MISAIPARKKSPDRIYDSNPAVATPEKRSQMDQCKHPKVQIVSRDDDAEFVECKECGEIFESSEFKDMEKERSLPEDV